MPWSTCAGAMHHEADEDGRGCLREKTRPPGMELTCGSSTDAAKCRPQTPCAADSKCANVNDVSKASVSCCCQKVNRQRCRMPNGEMLRGNNMSRLLLAARGKSTDRSRFRLLLKVQGFTRVVSNGQREEAPFGGRREGRDRLHAIRQLLGAEPGADAIGTTGRGRGSTVRLFQRCVFNGGRRCEVASFEWQGASGTCGELVAKQRRA
ncbi:hypothetical protein QBC47DRAFT_91801 [Echria macrotheca]|uniref:Uncharacterized protein n=1 Tax=Echria macrotheca TaxID=438768 RepID=A0AAJ0B5Q5_9PEZI|nr:hypothetical protein QBC47DRAFT_91801 [Echria macrotheca]